MEMGGRREGNIVKGEELVMFGKSAHISDVFFFSNEVRGLGGGCFLSRPLSFFPLICMSLMEYLSPQGGRGYEQGS